MTMPIFGAPAVAEAEAQQEVQDVGGVYRRPIITLAGGGDEVTLDGVGSAYTLKPGSTGLGLAPVELTKAELPGGGAVLRHRRRTGREIFLPIDVHFGTGAGEYADLEDARRRLEQICDDLVEIRLRGKDGVRTASGYLTGGLGGDFATSAVNTHRMNLGLTFDCLDPRFYGPQRAELWALSPSRTAFLSRLRDQPSVPRLVRTNHVLNPSIVGTSGRAVWVGSAYQSVASSASSEMPRYGDTSWRMEVTGTDGDRIGGRLDTYASEAMRYRAGLWVRPGTGVRRVRVSIESDQTGQWETTATRIVTSGGLPTFPQEWMQVVVEEDRAQGGNRRLRFELDARIFANISESIPTGSVSYVDGAVLTDAQSPVDFFDGGTTVSGHTTSWTGTANASSSELWTVPAPPDDTMAVPFGAMRLSASTVQGATEVTIRGDADAEAVLLIDGPGEDLEVINETTGQRIFVSGVIDETLTIDSRGGWQDIYSESMRDGQWWARVDANAPEELITLRPGVNRIRVTMVNAHPSSSVRLLYRETYRAGH